MIPTYLPGAHLRETLAGIALARADYGRPMQIEIVDDASPDCDVAALVASWGFQDVAVYRRDARGGIGRCWNTCVARAYGEWVHLLHQDDCVSPDYYSAVDEVATTHPESEMIFSRNVFIVGEKTHLSELVQHDVGPIDDWLDKITAKQLVQCAGVSIKRSLYRRVGGFDETLKYVIDWEMWIRIATLAQVAYLPRPLAAYRVHDGAESRRLKDSEDMVSDIVAGVRGIHKALCSAHREDRLIAVTLYIWQTLGENAIDLQSRGQPGMRCAC